MSTPQDAFERAILIAGSNAALARAIGITPWALSKLDKTKIPKDRCLAIEKFTNDQVTADELRPDINWPYVRAQNTQKAA